ncbi:hypothetical protein GCM10028807_62640 [Spirosoma daeguense]
MTDEEYQQNDLDDLLRDYENSQNTVFEELFEQRVIDSGLSERGALALLNTSYRPLHRVLKGSHKLVDFLLLMRISDFLQIPFSQVVELYLHEVTNNFGQEIDDWNRKKFILDNFDLPNLQKCGFLDNISDFKYIEEKIVTYFGLKDITDYGKEAVGAVFSSGKVKPKNRMTREFWVWSAEKNLRINNHYEYDRSKLIDYVPSIRWHTMNVEKGLFQVVRELFELGVTVIFEPHINDLHVRGATFAINDKPAIALTNYTKYYPSLWFALMHELHHILFDWEEIKINKRHISGDIDLFSMSEVEADNFAREFLFPKKNKEEIFPYINKKSFVAEYAKANYIHPSLIYIFYCWDNRESEDKSWAKFYDEIPSFMEAVKPLSSVPWQNRKSIKEVTKVREQGVFKGL